MKNKKQIIGLFVLIIVQIFCALFFISDVFEDAELLGGFTNMNLHLSVEAVSSIALIIAIGIEAKIMVTMQARHKEAEKTMAVARGALSDVIENYFKVWALTPAEKDVASFLIKGFSINEIAKMRESAEGTVKTQLNAVYNKAGISGRSQLVSLLIEDLMEKPLVS